MKKPKSGYVEREHSVLHRYATDFGHQILEFGLEKEGQRMLEGVMEPTRAYPGNCWRNRKPTDVFVGEMKLQHTQRGRARGASYTHAPKSGHDRLTETKTRFNVTDPTCLLQCT
jgi:hypothetical protein